MIASLPSVHKNKESSINDFSTANEQNIQNQKQINSSSYDKKNLNNVQYNLLLPHRTSSEAQFNRQIKTQRYTQKNNTMKLYKQIQDYRKISEHLDIMDKLKKVNSQKLKKLQKNVFNLNFLRKLSVRQSLRVQNKKIKLQQTQTMACFLQNLRIDKQKMDKQKNFERHHACLSMRQNNQRNKQVSHQIWSIVKQSRVRQFKQKNLQLLQKRERNLEQILQTNRLNAQKIRNSEAKLKEKLKKYQEYKVYLGRLNYSQKLQSQYFKHQKNRRYLDEVKQKVQQQDKLFRKTQKLKKQSKKIQQFYLTGVGTQ